MLVSQQEKRREERLRDLNAQYLFKCKPCLLGFKRRGMLVNHIAKYHPTMNPDEVPELSLPIMQTTRDFFCHLCEKVLMSWFFSCLINSLHCFSHLMLEVVISVPRFTRVMQREKHTFLNSIQELLRFVRDS